MNFSLLNLNTDNYFTWWSLLAVGVFYVPSFFITCMYILYLYGSKNNIVLKDNLSKKLFSLAEKYKPVQPSPLARINKASYPVYMAPLEIKKPVMLTPISY
jgi:hypothetical protein